MESPGSEAHYRYSLDEIELNIQLETRVGELGAGKKKKTPYTSSERNAVRAIIGGIRSDWETTKNLLNNYKSNYNPCIIYCS